MINYKVELIENGEEDGLKDLEEIKKLMADKGDGQEEEGQQEEDEDEVEMSRR